jgi:hypothetical protein
LRQGRHVGLERFHIALNLFDTLMPQFVDPDCRLAHVVDCVDLRFGRLRRRCRGELQCIEGGLPRACPLRPLRLDLFQILAFAHHHARRLAVRVIEIARCLGGVFVPALLRRRGLDDEMERLGSKRRCGNSQRFKFGHDQTFALVLALLPATCLPFSRRKPRVQLQDLGARAQPLDHHVRILRRDGAARPQRGPGSIQGCALLRQRLFFQAQGFQKVVLLADLAANDGKLRGSVGVLEAPIRSHIRTAHCGFELLRQGVGWTEGRHLVFGNRNTFYMVAADD